MDVISHIPVLCEDHNVPYVYVASRAELGAAGSTKRPTSVVMVTPQQQGAKKKVVADGEAEEDWNELYADLVKVSCVVFVCWRLCMLTLVCAQTVVKAGKDVRI